MLFRSGENASGKAQQLHLMVETKYKPSSNFLEIVHPIMKVLWFFS